MGTRHLIAVVMDGEPRVAQYGQWDGYPSGQGATVVKFLKGVNFELFKERVQKARFLTYEELHPRWEAAGGPPAPHFSRNCGADILAYVFETEEPELGASEWAFAANSLMCEWAYVVDLDQMVLEVYRGFQKSTHTDGRFHEMDHDDGWYPVRLVSTFAADDVPQDWEAQVEAAIGEGS